MPESVLLVKENRVTSIKRRCLCSVAKPSCRTETLGRFRLQLEFLWDPSFFWQWNCSFVEQTAKGIDNAVLIAMTFRLDGVFHRAKSRAIHARRCAPARDCCATRTRYNLLDLAHSLFANCERAHYSKILIPNNVMITQDLARKSATAARADRESLASNVLRACKNYVVCNIYPYKIYIVKSLATKLRPVSSVHTV